MDLHGDSPIKRRVASAPTAIPPWQSAFWQNLSQDAFAALPAPQKSELDSLRSERDPELFSSAMMSFAARRETERPELAGLLYQRVAQLEQAPAELRKRAQNRAAALEGNGTFGAQAEVLVSRFSKEALNPAPILAMGVAGSLFKISRALSLNVLRHSPIDRMISKATANGVGLLTESAAFTLTAKSVASGLGQAQDWSLPALKREWLAGTILLGSIKAGGALGVQSARSLAGGAARTESLAFQRGLSLAAGLSQPLGLYSGILLSHQIETGLGLRAAQGPANTLIDGAATLAHLYVGGRLAQGLGAERLNRVATEIEFRIGNLPGPRNGSPLSRFLNPAPAIAMAAKAGESLAWQPEIQRPFRSQALETTPFAPERNYIQEAYEVRDFLQRLPEVTSEHISNLINRQYPELNNGRLKHDFLWMLSRASVGRQTAILDSAIPTLSEALKFADMGSNSSSYSHWLTKQVFERSLRHTDIPTMDVLLQFLGDGGKVVELEASLGGLHPGLELPKGPPPMPSFWVGRENLYGRIRNLAVSPEAKTVLAKWAGTTASTRSHFLSISDFNLLGMLEYHQGLPHRAAQLDRVIRLAGESPMGLARFTRLQTLLEKGLDPLTEFKLEDLADPASHIHGRLQAWQASESPAPSQANAYLGARAPLALLSEMNSRRASLTDPVLAAARKARRNGILDRLFPGGVQDGHFRPEVLAEAFKALGDSTSLEIAQALVNRDFSIEILPAVAFRHRANELSATPPNEIETAYYYPPSGSRTKGLMIFRRPELSVYSKEAAREAFFGLMAGVVHEHRHHRDIQPKQIRTKDVHLYQEMSGHFSEHLWKAEHGDIYQYSIWTHDTSLGPAMRFHDFYERVYGHWWQGLSANQSTLKAGRQGP